jgi:hypothetical protein
MLMQPAGCALKDRQQTRAASCIGIIDNQDLDHANHIRYPAPPAIKAHQPASDQCIFTAQAHPDTQFPLAKACNIFTLRSSQTEPLPHCCAQRAGVSDSKYDAFLVSSAVRPCTPLSPTQTQNPNFVLVGPAQPGTSPRICGTASPGLSHQKYTTFDDYKTAEVMYRY